MLEGKLYAMGGDNADEGALASVERYDPALNAAWEAVEYVATAKEALEVAAEAAAVAGHDDAMVQALQESETLHLSRWGMASA